MNRILLLIGVVLVVGCGPEPRDMDTLLEVDGVFMNPVDGQPYSGRVFWILGGSGNRMTGSLTDGILNGPYVEYSYFRDGQLEEMTTYTFKNGDFVEDGPYEYYYDNGQLESKTTYKNGELDGPVEEYHDNGQLESKTTYKNGELDGPTEYYYFDGQLEVKRTYKDGKPDGPYEWYYRNGQLEVKRTYKDGELDGPFESYHENGEVRDKGTFQDGPFESYHDNGELWTKGIYKDGERCGEWFLSGETRTYDPC